MEGVPGPRDLTPEEEEEMIEKIADLIMRSGFGTAAVLFLVSVKPLAYVGAQMGMFGLAPFLPLLGSKGYDFLSLVEKKENVEKLIRRIEKLTEESKSKSKSK